MRYDEPSGYYTPDFYTSGPKSYLTHSQVIDLALPFHAGRRTVIQAGGHIGVWPRKLATHYAQVVSFEPVPSNWECLVMNANAPNVTLYREALGAKNGKISINVRATSSGGHHVATRMNRPRVEVRMRSLDSLGLTDVDALFLDIEGYEIEALKGAGEVLKNHPLLVIENNGCSRKFGYPPEALPKFLKPLGYRRVAQYHEDEIFV